MWVCSKCGSSEFKVEEDIVTRVKREILGDIKKSGLISLKRPRDFKRGFSSSKVQKMSIVCCNCKSSTDYEKGIKELATWENIWRVPITSSIRRCDKCVFKGGLKCIKPEGTPDCREYVGDSIKYYIYVR